MTDKNQAEEQFNLNEIRMLDALVSVDKEKLPEQALAQQWISLKLRPMDLLTAAMRSTKVQAMQSGPELTAGLVQRAQVLATPTADGEEEREDNIPKLTQDICTLLARAGDDSFPAPPHLVASSAAYQQSMTPKAAVTSVPVPVPMRYTEGLVVKPHEALAKYTAVRERIIAQDACEDTDSSNDDEDGLDADGKLAAKKSKKRSLQMLDELRLITPSDPGQSMPIIGTSDARELTALKPNQLKRAHRSFNKVAGLPVAPKSFPLLETLRAAGFPGAKLDTIKSHLSAKYKERFAPNLQDVNAVVHILNATLELVASIRTEKALDADKLCAIETSVYVVHMLQMQKLMEPGGQLMDEVCSALQLPDVTAIRAIAGRATEFSVQEQQMIVQHTKMMLELNSALRSNDPLPATHERRADSVETKDHPRSSFSATLPQTPTAVLPPECVHNSATSADTEHVASTNLCPTTTRNHPSRNRLSRKSEREHQTRDNLRISTSTGAVLAEHPALAVQFIGFSEAAQAWVLYCAAWELRPDHAIFKDPPPVPQNCVLRRTGPSSSPDLGDSDDPSHLGESTGYQGKDPTGHPGQNTETVSTLGEQASGRMSVQVPSGVEQAHAWDARHKMADARRCVVGVQTITTAAPTTTATDKQAGTDGRVHAGARSNAEVRTSSGVGGRGASSASTPPQAVGSVPDKRTSGATRSTTSRATHRVVSTAKAQPRNRTVEVLYTAQTQTGEWVQYYRTTTIHANEKYVRARASGLVSDRLFPDLPDTQTQRPDQAPSTGGLPEVQGQPDSATQALPVRQHPHLTRNDKPRRQVPVMGPQECIRPSADTPTAAPVAASAVPPAQDQQSDQASVKDSSTGIQAISLPAQESARGASDTTKVTGDTPLHSDGRHLRGGLFEPTRDAPRVGDHRVHRDHTQRDVQFQEADFTPTTPTKVVRDDNLFSCFSNVPSKRQSDQDSANGDDNDRSIRPEQHHHIPPAGKDEGDDDRSDGRSRHCAHSVYRIARDLDLPQDDPTLDQGPTNRSSDGGRSTAEATAPGPPPDSGGLQASKVAAADILEREVPPLRSPSGDDLRGRLQFPTRVHSTAGPEAQPPSYGTIIPNGQEGSAATHHRTGRNGGSGSTRRSDRDTQLPAGNNCDVRGRNSGSSVPPDGRRTQSSPDRASAPPVSSTAPETTRTPDLSHSRRDQPGRQTEQSNTGTQGVQAMHQGVSRVQPKVGSCANGLFRSEVEPPAPPIYHVSTHGPTGGGVRFLSPTDFQNTPRSFVDVPSTTHQASAHPAQDHQGAQPEVHLDPSNVGKGVHPRSTDDGAGHPSATAASPTPPEPAPQAYTIHQVEHSSTTRTCKSQIGVLLQGHANCNEELPKHLLSILKSATRSRNPPQSVVDILTDHGQRFSPICPKTAVNDLRSLSQMLIFATSAPTSLRPKEQRIRTSLQ